MATITAPPASSNFPMPAPATQPLWQVPVFLLGCAALVAAWLVRPLLSEQASRRLERDLASARQILSRPDGNIEQALTLTQRAVESSKELLAYAGEAAFLAGSAHIRIAEKADSVRAQESWAQARECLEQAELHGVPVEDQNALIYRLAKVGFHTGATLSIVIARFEESIPKYDNRAEGYALLTQAYLRLPKPDLNKAIEANLKLRQVPDADETALANAKLLAGELLLRMGKPDEARKSLEKIGDQGSPTFLVKAKLLQARAYQEEKKWDEAARLYEAVLAKSKPLVPDPGQVYYNLGLCYRQQDQPHEAANKWQEALTLSRGPEGLAAAILLAEQRLNDAALEPAAEVLARAVLSINSSADWKNPLVDANRAREVFEKALSAYRQSSRHDLAMKTIDAYARLAPAVRILGLRSEVAAEWARIKNEAPMASAETREQAKQLYRLAGESCAKLAELPGQSLSQQGEYLWTSAQNYLSAGEDALAGARLEEVVKMNLEPVKLGEAWYRLAELYRSTGKKEAAGKAYRKCMEYDTRFAYRARYQLAMTALESGDLDQAEADLVMNRKMLTWDSDPEALAQSLFALGNLLYQRRDYRRSVRYLEDALGRFKDHPDSAKARYQLADSYRLIAAQENQSFLLSDSMSEETRAHFQQQHRMWLQKAADEFASLQTFLETPEGKNQLTSDQRKHVPFIVARCWLYLGEYDKAVDACNKLIERHDGTVEGLDALGLAVLCHAAQKNVDKVKQRLLQIQQLLPKMPDDVRKQWEEWLAEATKPLKGL
jgi:tetratricopeptide (TPR) repeat protein